MINSGARMRPPGNIDKNKGWEALVVLLATSTQVELAERTGLRQSALSDIVNLRKKPNVREVVALSNEGIAPVLWMQPIGKARERRRGAA